MSLRLTLLGAFQATIGEQRLTRFRSDKVRALLAYLAVEGNQPHRRETLSALLWSDVPDTIARKNLRTSLYRLKGAIEQKADKSLTERLFTNSNRSIQANVDGDQGLFWVDVSVFQEQLAACETHAHADLFVCPSCSTRLETAVSLYKGGLLPGFHLDEADLFDEWLLLKREQLHQQAQHALDLLINIHQEKQNFDRVRDYCQRQLELEPWRESAFRQLMLALARNGQRSAALAQFEKCRQVLWDELGVEPGADTLAVYEEVKAGKGTGGKRRQGTKRTAPPHAVEIQSLHNLPARMAPYFGRQAEREELSTLLTNPDYRLVTLVGEGGVGKTSLAVEAGRDLAKDFADGVWLVQLAGLDGMEGNGNGKLRDEAILEDEIATAVSQALSLSMTGNKSPKEQLLSYLRQRRLLLILDNFEHVLDGADIVRAILQEASRVSILATSREPLAFLAEAVFPVAGLPLPSSDSSAAENAPSLQLFADRAQRIMHYFSLNANNQAHVTQICQLVEGSPLGIELAAATLSKRPLTDLLTAIQTSIDSLASRRRDLPRRHRSMRAVFDGSWVLLLPQEQQILAQLSVFRGGFSIKAAQAITGATSSTLETLRDKSLLQGDGDNRFRLHELLRQFAQEKVEELEQSAQNQASQTFASLSQRHSDFYLNFVAEREDPLQGATPQVPAEEIELELDNIRKGWRTAVSRLASTEAASASATLGNSVKPLGLFYQLRGRYQEAEQAFAAAIKQLTNLESRAGVLALARVMVQQAHALIRLARYDEAIVVVKTAVLHAHQAQDLLTEGTAYLLWGISLWRQGQYEAAEDKLNIALTTGRTVSSSLLQAASNQNLGVIRDYQGLYEEAHKLLNNALQIWQASQNQKQIGLVLNSIGTVNYHRRKLPQAQEAYERALEINFSLGNRQGQMVTLNNLSLIATEQQAFDKAQEYLLQGLNLARQSGDHAGESLIFRNLGWAAYEQKSFDAAQIYLDQALQISQRIGDQWGESGALKILGDINRALSYFDEAIGRYNQSITISRNIGNKYQECYSLIGLSQTYQATADNSQAKEQAEKALRLAQEINNLNLQQTAKAILDSRPISPSSL